jgi:hypothetical protein
MTTPSDSPDHPAEGPPSAAQTDSPTAAVPTVGPDTRPPSQPPEFWLPPGQPFAPVARAPRTPWVNPARRGHVAAVAIVLALVFGGGGVLLAHVVTHHGRQNGVVRFQRVPGMGGPGFGRGQLPRRQFPPRRGPTATVAPTPSASSSTTS